VSEHRIGEAAEVPEGRFLCRRVGDRDIGVIRVGGELRAYENRCPHQGGPVCLGEVVPHREAVLAPDGRWLGERDAPDDVEVACPWHGFSFRVRSGENIADARLRLRSWAVVERSGAIYVRDPREGGSDGD
jgi:nitrite reductase (NADH) small subunit